MRLSCKQIILGMVQYMPAPLIRLVYRIPFAARLASRLLKQTAAAGKPSIVTIRQGTLAGWKLQVDNNTPHYYWIKGHDEPAVLKVMQQHIQPASRVIDIGAHIGIETLMLSQWVGHDGQVLSIEPDPNNFKSLTANVQLNDVTNVQLLQAAVSETTGQLQFEQGRGVMCRLVEDPDDPTVDKDALITVQVHTLDALTREHFTDVDFVKIDVEDFEVSVLAGAGQLLSEQQPIIVLELHSYRSATGCADILRQAGYDLTLVDTREKDLDQYLQSQPMSDCNHGFERCHLLATAPHKRQGNS